MTEEDAEAPAGLTGHTAGEGQREILPPAPGGACLGGSHAAGEGRRGHTDSPTAAHQQPPTSSRPLGLSKAPTLCPTCAWTTGTCAHPGRGRERQVGLAGI